MKTYQLLRNNQLMGYYTKTCLLQIGLQPLDLLWIEGESITWKYPSELEEFKAYVPQVEVTDASIVNNRKEKQIKYFGSHIAEMDYKKVNIQSIQEPDAVEFDITPGFEYMVIAENNRLEVNEVEVLNAEDVMTTQEAVDAVQTFINQLSIFNEELQMNVPEQMADRHQFTTIWERGNQEGELVAKPSTRKYVNFEKFALSTIITGLVTIASVSTYFIF